MIVPVTSRRKWSKNKSGFDPETPADTHMLFVLDIKLPGSSLSFHGRVLSIIDDLGSAILGGSNVSWICFIRGEEASAVWQIKYCTGGLSDGTVLLVCPISIVLIDSDKMAEENIPTPTRFDDQLVPLKPAYLMGRAIFSLIYRNSNVPSIYIHQFWNNLKQEAKSGVYSFQLDEQWFTLNIDHLCEALDITPVDLAHLFVSPPVGEQFMEFVNGLCYPEEIHFVSKMHGNNLYQPWRAMLTLINQCLTGKTSKSDKPRNHVLQMMWDIISTKDLSLRFTLLVMTFSLAISSSFPKKPAPAKQMKPVKEKSTKPTPLKKSNKGKVKKVQKGKSSLQLVDEDEEAHGQAPVDGVSIFKPISGITRSLPVVEGKGKGIATDEQLREGDTEILNVGKEKGEDVSNIVALEEIIVELDEDQVGSDPGNTLESRPPPDEDQAGLNPGPSHVALAGPNLEPMHEDFIATVYTKVHESMKHTTEEHVFLENPPSSLGFLSSMKNLDDAFTFGDHFIVDKPTKKEPGKANVEFIVEFTITVPIHQASLSAPPLSTPIINLITSKPICANFEKKNKVHDQTTQSLSSRIFTLENYDLYSRIENYVRETVQEAVQKALQAPVRERFREISKFDMKEILRGQMFKSGSYRSQPKHVALYDALEASIDRENRDEFLKATAKSRKRRHDDQDPPPPPLPDSDQSKKKRHVLMHLLLNSLKLRRPQLRRLLTQKMLLLALQSKSLIPNMDSQLMTFQYQMMCISQI
nr:hypothetical protein [Tanacetum cinerariifolium]